jgi:hypothetical protein
MASGQECSFELPLSSRQLSMCVDVSRSSDPSIGYGTTHSSITSDNELFTLFSKRCGRDEISVEHNGAADEAEQTGDVHREELRLRQDQGRGCVHVNEHLDADENEQIVIPSLDQMLSVRRIRRSGLTPMVSWRMLPRQEWTRSMEHALGFRSLNRTRMRTLPRFAERSRMR